MDIVSHFDKTEGKDWCRVSLRSHSLFISGFPSASKAMEASKLTPVCHASALLLIMDSVITLSK